MRIWSAGLRATGSRANCRRRFWARRSGRTTHSSSAICKLSRSQGHAEIGKSGGQLFGVALQTAGKGLSLSEETEKHPAGVLQAAEKPLIPVWFCRRGGFFAVFGPFCRSLFSSF